jgi:hypothetical protein
VATQRTKVEPNEVHGESSDTVPTTEPSDLVTQVKVVPLNGEVEVTVSTSFQVNLGNFENKQAFASAKARFSTDTDTRAASDYLWDRVYSSLAPELEQAADLTVHSSKVRGDKEGTFVHLLVSDQ